MSKSREKDNCLTKALLSNWCSLMGDVNHWAKDNETRDDDWAKLIFLWIRNHLKRAHERNFDSLWKPDNNYLNRMKEVSQFLSDSWMRPRTRKWEQH